MTDTDDLEFDDPAVAAIGDDELPSDDEELDQPPSPASVVPAEPVTGS